ncbi:MAG: GGDEF domain-containing protein [Gammaproteobacteria bacterium]|nr:GGDEF domain-containing protein [Gammaproteobacteria bacterium]NIR96551.1 GGDEF domain-containing protein [Gammaproteobacteria bacterium]NIT62289.1 GGDEF domain-containing protein [Gammaproteobacteria bacterium]NIV19193.1 diguanylate cyclase [Gammaproteobacteria bacterium]NIX10061.1 diguanylate cyclase [Gammaproteobacteria bacterium]
MSSNRTKADVAQRLRATHDVRKVRRMLELAHVLQTTLEVDNLFALFAKELAKDVPHDGLAYRNAEHGIDLQLGTRARHTCEYRLSIGNHSLGEVELSRGRKFMEAETAALEYALSSLLYPLRNALMYHNAVATALTDPLTGVSNRVSLDSTLRREVELARRHGNALALVVLDIDRFKAINDEFGHLIGDCVLKEIAQCAGGCARSSDMLFRYGGEEFVLVLSNTDLTGARMLAERIRYTVEKLCCRYGKASVDVTVSLGVTCLKAEDAEQSLFDRADRALLQAKREGRNRVVVAE